ncbi:MAG TPA: deoxyribose-phosphate aldolase [Clostridia bacterium]|nr:deoxyribose-phosphate aldolase [Clostridia bacterium]
MPQGTVVTSKDSVSSVAVDWRTVAQLIDHTLLKPEATREQVSKLCAEAVKYNFFSVMVNPSQVAHAAALVQGSRVKVGTVIGFPLGATTSTAKLAESVDALRLGACELDMVINVGALKSGERILVQSEIKSLADVAHRHGAILKVIIETALLTTDEKILACTLAAEVGADFVKTSTGFSSAGATVADVQLMRGVVGARVGVKAAGGIRSAKDVLAMMEAGATRVGASASVAIVRELGARE